MGLRKVVLRVRHAIFGRPLTHEEAKARHEAQIATMRAGGQADTHSRASASQSYMATF